MTFSLLSLTCFFMRISRIISSFWKWKVHYSWCNRTCNWDILFISFSYTVNLHIKLNQESSVKFFNKSEKVNYLKAHYITTYRKYEIYMMKGGFAEYRFIILFTENIPNKWYSTLTMGQNYFFLVCQSKPVQDL